MFCFPNSIHKCNLVLFCEFLEMFGLLFQVSPSFLKPLIFKRILINVIFVCFASELAILFHIRLPLPVYLGFFVFVKIRVIYVCSIMVFVFLSL